MKIWPRYVTDWGTRAGDREHDFACDGLVADPDMTLYRAVDAAAPAAVSFRWLCQMQVAPYSYDKLDNRGRRSPQELIPGLDRLEPGQRWMEIFKLTEFEPGRSITLYSNGWLFGEVGLTYLAVPDGDREDRSRIVVKIRGRCRRTPLGLAMRVILPPGDLVMMRRQLLNFAELAERTPASAVAGATPVPG